MISYDPSYHYHIIRHIISYHPSYHIIRLIISYHIIRRMILRAVSHTHTHTRSRSIAGDTSASTAALLGGQRTTPQEVRTWRQATLGANWNSSRSQLRVAASSRLRVCAGRTARETAVSPLLMVVCSLLVYCAEFVLAEGLFLTIHSFVDHCA